MLVANCLLQFWARVVVELSSVGAEHLAHIKLAWAHRSSGGGSQCDHNARERYVRVVKDRFLAGIAMRLTVAEALDVQLSYFVFHVICHLRVRER